MFHFTHTGYYAGLTYCGAPRTADQGYQHPGYSFASIARQLASPDLCPSCRAEWDAAGDNCPDCGGRECGNRGCQS